MLMMRSRNQVLVLGCLPKYHYNLHSSLEANLLAQQRSAPGLRPPSRALELSELQFRKSLSSDSVHRMLHYGLYFHQHFLSEALPRSRRLSLHGRLRAWSLLRRLPGRPHVLPSLSVGILVVFRRLHPQCSRGALGQPAGNGLPDLFAADVHRSAAGKESSTLLKRWVVLGPYTAGGEQRGLVACGYGKGVNANTGFR